MALNCFCFGYKEFPDGQIGISDCPAPVEVLLINKKNGRHLFYCKDHWKRDSKGILLTIFDDEEEHYFCSDKKFTIIDDKDELEVAAVMYE